MNNQTGVNELNRESAKYPKFDFQIEAQQKIGSKLENIQNDPALKVHARSDSNYELEDSGMAEDGSESGS